MSTQFISLTSTQTHTYFIPNLLLHVYMHLTCTNSCIRSFSILVEFLFSLCTHTTHKFMYIRDDVHVKRGAFIIHSFSHWFHTTTSTCKNKINKEKKKVLNAQKHKYYKMYFLKKSPESLRFTALLTSVSMYSDGN